MLCSPFHLHGDTFCSCVIYFENLQRHFVIVFCNCSSRSQPGEIPLVTLLDKSKNRYNKEVNVIQIKCIYLCWWVDSRANNSHFGVESALGQSWAKVLRLFVGGWSLKESLVYWIFYTTNLWFQSTSALNGCYTNSQSKYMHTPNCNNVVVSKWNMKKKELIRYASPLTCHFK